jgi:tRNA-Thr(GGU) m(6)t(6)A37 methyltransferase TsaA
MNNEAIIHHPIGYVRSEQKYRYETSRQGVLSDTQGSFIELLPHHNFEQALLNLDGFERIWVIFQFHLNDNWKPMVQPPRHTRKKVGVFSSRAPYRPNGIGMSCVRLLRVDGLRVDIDESDILDGSPVLDIKPYLPYSDSFPDVKTGWVKNGLEKIYQVKFLTVAAKQVSWLREQANINLQSFSKLQLEFNPTDDSRKRIACLSETDKEYNLAYRTWRIVYTVIEQERTVLVSRIESGYSSAEVADIHEDKYEDKSLHHAFIEEFKNLK